MDPQWFERAFDEWYPVVYAHRSVEAAASEARFAAERLRLCPNDTLLDLCCGNGRHMTHLVHCASAVVGLDFSVFLLKLAAAALGADARLVRADMRAIPFVSAFDAVVSFFTSFGYFLTPQENLDVVLGVARALRPGGRFFIDYVNAAYIGRMLKPRSARTEGGYEIEDSRWIDTAQRRLNKLTVVTRDGCEVRRVQESIYLYEPPEFLALLASGGLTVDEMVGDYSGAPLEDSRPRMIVVGHRA